MVSTDQEPQHLIECAVPHAWANLSHSLSLQTHENWRIVLPFLPRAVKVPVQDAPELASENNLEILLVEDNPGDVFLIQRALKKHSTISLVNAGDGRDAIELLQKRISDRAKLPDLILLDLAMPRMDGHELLAEIKRDKSLPYVPVVVFSSSDDKRDVAKSYRLGAIAYVGKPSGLPDFTTVCDLIARLVLKMAKRPRRTEA